MATVKLDLRRLCSHLVPSTSVTFDLMNKFSSTVKWGSNLDYLPHEGCSDAPSGLENM